MNLPYLLHFIVSQNICKIKQKTYEIISTSVATQKELPVSNAATSNENNKINYEVIQVAK